MKNLALTEKEAVVRLEINLEKLESLFSSGLLCAADIRCLNRESKKHIWNLCLGSCSRCLIKCKHPSLGCHAVEDVHGMRVSL